MYKKLDGLEIANCEQEPYRFCMFSRVMPEKGVEDAMRAIRHVNEKNGKTVAVLDIYGPIENQYDERFQWALKNIGGGIQGIAALYHRMKVLVS